MLDSHMLSARKQDTRLLLNHGELVELWLVFPELGEVAPTGLAREPSETCAEVDECLPPPEPGDAGTEKSTLTRRDMLSALPSLPQESPLLSCQKVTE